MTNKIWLKHYPPGVPAQINPDAYSSIVDLFEKACTQFKDKPAISNFGSVLTFGQLESRSRQFAAYLQNVLKLEKGDRVGIMLPNVLQYYVAMFGILRAGLIIVNINPLYKPPELEYELNNAEVKTLIVLENFAHTVSKVLHSTPLQHIIISKIGDLFSPVKGLLANFLVKYIKKQVQPYHIPQFISFKKLMNEAKALTFKAVEINNEDIAFLQYTGGTTGIAKGAMLSHKNMIANVEQSINFLGQVLQKAGEIVIAPLPLYHIFSLTVCTLCFMKMGSVCVLITDPRDISALIKVLAKTPYTVLVGINTLFNALLNQPAFLKLDFSRLKLTIAGGMQLQTTVAERWQAVTGKFILEGYGLTEASPVVTVNPPNINRVTSSIGIPIPSTDVTLLDDQGREMPSGEPGELCVKGPQVMRGYWRNEEETRKVFTKDGWLKTGDIARMDDEGFFYIIDRKKDMILVSGFNVYPNEIEEVIASHPGVLEVAVVAVPSEATGEAVKAFIVKKDPLLTADEIIAYCRVRLTGYKIPKEIEFRSSLPKSNVGKILRRELRGEKQTSSLMK